MWRVFFTVGEGMVNQGHFGVPGAEAWLLFEAGFPGV